MHRRFFNLISTSLLVISVSAGYSSTPVTQIDAESMSYGGYTGPVPASVSFDGLRFYGNSDSATAPLQLPHIPGRYKVSIRGASANSNRVGISFYVGSARVASLSFQSAIPVVLDAQFDIKTAPSSARCMLRLEDDDGSSDTDIDYIIVSYEGQIPPPPPPPNPSTTGAYQTGVYRNLFSEIGKTSDEISSKIDTIFQQLFYGNDDNQRLYYPVGDDMAYILDVGNNDVRSEGMSYAMMICVQLDKKEEFDRLWRWARTSMYNTEGEWKGYYSWQVSRTGTIIDQGSAPDGEEYFAMALFFASHRWGDEEGIFNYGAMARELLSEMLNHESRVNPYSSIRNMFNASEKKVVFSPNNMSALFTDPSYHLPSFYQLWGLWADEDNGFWAAAADTSRAFFKRTTHPATGLSPDYAEFDGSPKSVGNHADFRFDAWRTAMNIAMDYSWWAVDPWQTEVADRIQNFFYTQGIATYGNQYTIDGSMLSGDNSPGLIAMNATASLAATDSKAWEFVQRLWEISIPTGQWRYYDGMLYMLGVLHCSGNFRIYSPESSVAPRQVKPTLSAGVNTQALKQYDLTGRLVRSELPTSSRSMRLRRVSVDGKKVLTLF